MGREQVWNDSRWVGLVCATQWASSSPLVNMGISRGGGQLPPPFPSPRSRVCPPVRPASLSRRGVIEYPLMTTPDPKAFGRARPLKLERVKQTYPKNRNPSN